MGLNVGSDSGNSKGTDSLYVFVEKIGFGDRCER